MRRARRGICRQNEQQTDARSGREGFVQMRAAAENDEGPMTKTPQTLQELGVAAVTSLGSKPGETFCRERAGPANQETTVTFGGLTTHARHFPYGIVEAKVGGD